MLLQTYVTFDGTCREALEFYRRELGAEIVMVSPYSDLPKDAPMQVGLEHADRVLHARFLLGGQVIMASDSFPGQPVNHSGFSLSLNLEDKTAAETVFDALSNGGQVTMPLAKTFWAELFGVCTDKFGISWMVNVD